MLVEFEVSQTQEIFLQTEISWMTLPTGSATDMDN
jgi:hypothetical protein